MATRPSRTPARSRQPEPERADDATLVTALRGGATGAARTEAFTTLVRRHERGLFALALSLLHDATEAEDMTQEAFIRAFRNLDLLADPAKFGIWARHIVFGVCVDWLRVFRPQLFRSTDVPGGTVGHDRTSDGAESHLAFDPPDESPSALDRLERAELAARILAAIDRLPARYRVPFTLFHVDGLSHAKVAAALGAPESTVRSLVARARRRLASLLAADGGERSPARANASLQVLEEPVREPRLMHVLNGDSVRLSLERSDIPGNLTVWADVLHEGPVPPASGTREWRKSRAHFIALAGIGEYAEALRRYEEWDARLQRFRDFDEIVLWFEHDLFDQLLLVRHLDWFSRQHLGHASLRLICIGEFPGIPDFTGLGQLSPSQLSSLLDTRQPITDAELRLGQEAWAAFTAPDPTALQRLVGDDGDTPAPGSGAPLPFLPGALWRLLADYPAIGDGLPLTERRILTCLVDGPLSLGELFAAEQRLEERVFMGDSIFWTRLRALAAGARPLVTATIAETVSGRPPEGSAELTADGRDVLAGRADWVRLCGFDRWLGGVHLVAPAGGDVAWRWDVAAKRLRRTGHA